MNDHEKLSEAMRLITEVQAHLEPPASIPVSAEELVFGYKPSNWILWKPISDSTGNAVLLLPGSWPQPTMVAVLADDGRWEQFDFAGIANGDRYHFRGSRPGQGYRGIAKKGGIRVYWGDSFGLIEFIDQPKKRQGA